MVKITLLVGFGKSAQTIELFLSFLKKDTIRRNYLEIEEIFIILQKISLVIFTKNNLHFGPVFLCVYLTTTMS